MQRCQQISHTVRKYGGVPSALNILYNIHHRVVFLSQTEMERAHTINYSEHCVDLHKAVRSLVILPQGILLHFSLKNK